MKVISLFFLVGCAFATSSEWRWQTGKQHVFEYSGRLLTGMPQMASHYSGLGINATVLIDVISQEKFQLSLEHPQFTRINERLQAHNSMDGPDGANWREVLLPEMSEVDSDIRQLLEQPLIFEVVRGEILAAKISRDEPEWSVNFKKALALLFQTKVDSASWEVQDNQVSGSFSENFWKTKEESIDGICEVSYQINELPKYMIRDRPELIPFPQECPEQKYFEVVKTKNIDNCEKRASFSFHKPGRFACTEGNCKTMWARTSETRVVACGTRGNLVIQTIINQGELNQNLMGFNTERVVSGNLQILRLKEIRTASPRPQPQNLVSLKSMMFEYSYKNYQQTQEQDQPRLTSQVAKEVSELAKALPKTMLSGLKNPIPTQKVVEEVKRLLKSVVQELANPIEDDLTEKQVTMKMLEAARGLAMLKKTEINQIYQSLKSELSQQEQSFKNLLFDAVLMTGTPEAVYFLKEQMTNGEMSRMQIISMFMWLPNSLMVPTEELLEELFTLVKSQKVQESPLTKNIAIMSFTNLLQKACLAPNREASYPTDIFGKFCSPDSPIVMQKWTPYLIQELESASSWSKQNEIIVALGMLTHQEIISKLIPFVEGRVQSGETVPQMTRLLALWSLSTSGTVQPQTVEPIFYSIYSNPAESTEMRISAFNVLLKMNPAMAVFHKIATRTWTEQDLEVLKVVNVAFYTLSQESKRESVLSMDVMSLPNKVNLVYPLIKKVRAIIPSSATIYTTEYLPKLGVGYEGLTSWIASNSSFIPKQMYTEFTYFLSQYSFQPWALGLRFEGAENLYRRFAEIVTPVKSGQTGQEHTEEFASKIKSALNSEWRQIIQKLNIKAQESGKMSGAAFLSMMETTPLFANFEQMSTELLKEKIAPFLRDPQSLKSKVCGETRFTRQRTIDMAPAEFLVPTDMGFPLNIEVHTPVVMSFKGTLNLDCNLAKPSLTMKSKVFYAAQYTAWVGTVIPFTNEYVVTAIDQTNVLNLPATLKVNLDLPKQHMRLSIKLDEEARRPFDLFHYHVHPFTTIKKIDDFTPLALTANKKAIKSCNEAQKVTATVGEYLGLHFTSELTTESRYTDMKAVLEKMSLYKFNPMNVLRFPWSNAAMTSEALPSLRRHEYSLKWDPSQSSTKELAMDIKLGVASKAKAGEPIQYHKIKLAANQQEVEEMAERESDPIRRALKKLSPFVVESESVESKTMHEKRQEKISKVIKTIEPVDQAQAMTIRTTTSLLGSGRPRTWSYVMTLVGGHKAEISERKIKSKWSIVLESEDSQTEIKINGNIVMPILPIWNINELRASIVDFRYFNTFQYLSNGEKKWNIDVEGNAKVSHEQKEHSATSSEGKACLKLQEEKQQHSSKAVLARMSEACEATRQQARSLDEVDFAIKYVNLPRSVEIYESVAFDTLKTLLWPFKKANSQSQKSVSASVKDSAVLVRVMFNRETPSFDMTIKRAQEKVSFTQIRLPYPLALAFPLKAGVNNIKLVAQKAANNNLYPLCKVEDETLKTFDNRSMHIHIDNCFHLMSADSSPQHKFAVLTRVMKPGNRRELKVILSEVKIVLTPSERPSTRSTFPSIKVTINEEEMSLVPNQWSELRSSRQAQRVFGHIFRSQNNVIQIKAPKFELEITFDGDDFAIETTQMMKGQLTGLCGNQNQQPRDEVEGPQKCIYSKPEVRTASYRVNNMPQGCDQVQPLSQNIKQKLQSENEQCIKQQEIPTKISKSLRTQSGQCTILKHAVIKNPGQICISKRPVTQCAAGCQTSHSQLLMKKVPFTCLSDDRVAEHYVKKANQGQKMPELESRQTSFETEVPQPRSCVPASNEL